MKSRRWGPTSPPVRNSQPPGAGSPAPAATPSLLSAAVWFSARRRADSSAQLGTEPPGGSGADRPASLRTHVRGVSRALTGGRAVQHDGVFPELLRVRRRASHLGIPPWTIEIHQQGVHSGRSASLVSAGSRPSATKSPSPRQQPDRPVPPTSVPQAARTPPPAVPNIDLPIRIPAPASVAPSD